MEAKETVMSVNQIGDIMQPCVSPTAQGVVVAQAQAEITGKIMKQEGIRVVVEWIKANADLERGDHDVGLCFEDYLHFDYDKWQAKLKEWGIK